MKLWVHVICAAAGLAVPASLEAWSMTSGGPRSAAHYAEVTQQSESPKDLVLAFGKLAFDERKPDEAVSKYVAADFVDHAPAGDYLKGREGSRIVEHVIGEGDLVAVHQQLGDKAAIDIFRVAKGKIVEHWDAQTS